AHEWLNKSCSEAKMRSSEAKRKARVYHHGKAEWQQGVSMININILSSLFSLARHRSCCVHLRRDRHPRPLAAHSRILHRRARSSAVVAHSSKQARVHTPHTQCNKAYLRRS